MTQRQRMIVNCPDPLAYKHLLREQERIWDRKDDYLSPTERMQHQITRLLLIKAIEKPVIEKIYVRKRQS